MELIQEIDYGTPKRVSETNCHAGNRRQVRHRARGHVADSRRGRGRRPECRSFAPRDNWKPFGSCRLCLVEIDGRKGTPASCTTPVEAGNESSHAIAAPRQIAPRRDGTLHLRSPAGLAERRGKPAIANFRIWLRWSACARFATARRARITRTPKRTIRIHTSPSIPPNASCARAACAPATKSKALSR